MTRPFTLFAPLALLLAFQANADGAGTAVQKHADREALKSAVRDVLSSEPLNTSRVGVEVVSLDTGEVVFQHHPDDLLNPASNVKLFTAAAALGRLGPEYRFETEFHVDEPLDGKPKTLFVRGKGDPSITTERLYGMVSELLHAGLRDVTDIVIDETWFDVDRQPAGYDQENSDRSYMSPPGAVSLNWNTIAVHVRGGLKKGEKPQVSVEPMSEFFVVEAKHLTTSRRRRLSVSSSAMGDKQKLEISGSLPTGEAVWTQWKKIDNPPMYFGQTLRAILVQRGVKVKGKVRLGTVPDDAKLLHVAQSESLDLILKRLNKNSSNFVAEQLIKTLGAEVKGPPGTTPRGIEVVEEFLARDVGIPRGSYVMKNGSGLNDTNRFSAAQISRLLKYVAAQQPTMPEFLSSLGIAGKDGTLRYRFEGSSAVGRLRAKTGTLENVTALSGFVVALGGERFAFSMMVNDYAGRAGPVLRGLDAMGAALAASGSAEGPSRAVAEAFQDHARPGSLDEVRTRVRTYLALGRQADRRNIPFLRTAWRNERDPAVRAVVAESLYRSDPQDYLAARTLLDSFAATPEVYGRLRNVALELGVEVPGFASIVELAAAGNLDAASRVAELSRTTQGDAPAQREIGEALSEIARTAPEELLRALRSAPDPDLDAATTLLAQGLVAEGDADHPFWRALRRSMGAVDAEFAAFSREMEVTLSKRIADHKVPPAGSPDARAITGEKEPPVAETRPGG